MSRSGAKKRGLFSKRNRELTAKKKEEEAIFQLLLTDLSSRPKHTCEYREEIIVIDSINRVEPEMKFGEPILRKTLKFLFMISLVAMCTPEFSSSKEQE